MKRLLIPLIVSLYATQIPLVLSVWTLYTQTDTSAVKYYLLTALPFGFASFVLEIFNVVFGFKASERTREATAKTVLICKSVLIPFFIVNFTLCALFLAAFLNPFLLWAIPAVISVCSVLTYFAVFASSAYNLGDIRRRIKNRETTWQNMLAHIIFHVLFVFDLAGSVWYFVAACKETARTE